MFAEPIYAADTDDTRVCGNCGEPKELDQFYKDGKDKDGNYKYRRDCKECYRVTRLKERKKKSAPAPAPKPKGRRKK